MEVVAIEMGFYKGERKRIGARFDVDGKHIPKWVKPVSSDSEAEDEAKKAKFNAEKKLIDGVRAASGGKAAKDKIDSLSEQV